MVFEKLRVSEVRKVIRYRPNIKRWSAKVRKDHIIGIHLSGSALHDFGYQKFVLSGKEKKFNESIKNLHKKLKSTKQCEFVN